MQPHNLHPVVARLVIIITWFENALLIAMLSLMVGLAGGQILMRNFFDISLYGADQMLRLLVLWVALLGAVTASREGKHIHVDAIARWLPGRVKSATHALTDLFTLSVCLVLAWQAFRFMQSAYGTAEMAFGAMPVWLTASILPLGFSLISLRYGLRLMHHVQQARGREEARE